MVRLRQLGDDRTDKPKKHKPTIRLGKVAHVPDYPSSEQIEKVLAATGGRFDLAWLHCAACIEAVGHALPI